VILISMVTLSVAAIVGFGYRSLSVTVEPTNVRPAPPGRDG
jgi:hypothetical protein